jgi:hypothetical protein
MTLLVSVFKNTSTTIRLKHHTAFIGFQTDATEAKPKHRFF